MIPSSRRNLMKGTIALAALCAMPGSLRAAGRAPAVFIFDARFTASRHLALAWQQEGIAILDPRDHDLGLAWREHIPRLLARGGGMEGATLWSDRFVCETFAKEHGLSASRSHGQLPEPSGGALLHWRLI